jgi:hypothetical protein
MRNRDKLDRWRNTRTAILTVHHDIPFWIALTTRERTQLRNTDVGHFYRQNGAKRRQFRDFIRALCVEK